MYIADLHIHSRYSRATSRDLTPEQLDFQARKKGIRLLGTGDFNSSGLERELKENADTGRGRSVPSPGGLRSEPGGRSGGGTDQICGFSGEISSIYKQDGKVRKVHSLILLPGLEEAEKLSARLEAIGNIHSDGRPILGLSCHDLLEIMLETCPEGMFIPGPHLDARPIFSMFGALSGFDRAEECIWGADALYPCRRDGALLRSAYELAAFRIGSLPAEFPIQTPTLRPSLGWEAKPFKRRFVLLWLKTGGGNGRGLDGTIELFSRRRESTTLTATGNAISA